MESAEKISITMKGSEPFRSNIRRSLPTGLSRTELTSLASSTAAKTMKPFTLGSSLHDDDLENED